MPSTFVSYDPTKPGEKERAEKMIDEIGQRMAAELGVSHTVLDGGDIARDAGPILDAWGAATVVPAYEANVDDESRRRNAEIAVAQIAALATALVRFLGALTTACDAPTLNAREIIELAGKLAPRVGDPDDLPAPIAAMRDACSPLHGADVPNVPGGAA